MMDAETEFRERLEAKIEAAIGEGSSQLACGYAEDFANYKERVGFLRALNQCLDLCAEVEKEMRK